MAAQSVFTPLRLEKGVQYSNSMSDPQKITIYTSNEPDDYSMMLPVNMGNPHQYLSSDGSLSMIWDDLAIKVLTTTERNIFGVAGYTTVGTICYDTTTAQTYIWSGSAWTSISGSAIDATFYISDNLNSTKRLRFEVSTISASTTRVITAADRDLNLNTPIFSNLGLINGANTFTITPAAMASSIAITLPIALPTAVLPASVSAISIAAPLVSNAVGTTIFSNSTARVITSDTWIVDNAGAPIAVGEAGKLEFTPIYNTTVAGDDVTTHRYMNMLQPTGTSVVTNAAAMYFNAIAGTHKAIAAGTTPAGQLHTTSGYLKIDINGTIHYIPVYTAAQISP